MRVDAVYSYLNGREFLLVHKPALWRELEQVVAAVDASACRTKRSKEKRSVGRLLYSPKAMNAAFRRLLEAKGWAARRVNYWVTKDERLIRKTLPMAPAEQRRAIESAGAQAIASYNQTDFVRDRVAIEVQFGKYAFVAYDLFVKHLAFFVGDEIDVGIEILPMKQLCQQMSSGVPYYEGEVYNVIRQGRGVPAVPLIVVGITP